MEFISSRKNSKIVHLKKLGASAAYRKQCGEYLCDGGKLLEEAIAHRIPISAVAFCTRPDIQLPEGVPEYEVTRDLIEYVSPLKTPQDVVFSCRIDEGTVSDVTGCHHIVLDGIQDPGNLGTIIRTANAFMIDTVILTGGCADIYNPKTIRATMGALFRQKIVELDVSGIKKLKTFGIKLYGAGLCEGCRDFRSVPLENAAVAIGSEGHGLSKDIFDICDERIIIPMNPDCESLNAAVAASVIMWEMFA